MTAGHGRGLHGGACVQPGFTLGGMGVGSGLPLPGPAPHSSALLHAEPVQLLHEHGEFLLQRVDHALGLDSQTFRILHLRLQQLFELFVIMFQFLVFQHFSLNIRRR